MDKVFLISKYWAKIRPTSTEYDPETSDAENEIERLQLRYRKLKYKIKAALKNSRKQEKIINQLKLKNETLNNEKRKELQNYENDLQEKQKQLQAFENRLGELQIDNQRLATQKENCENVLKDTETKLQSCDRENQKYKNDLQEKQEELQASEKQYKTFRNCE